MRLKNEPSAVNMSVLLNEVTRPMADNAPNQALCSTNDDAPAGRSGASPATRSRAGSGGAGRHARRCERKASRSSGAPGGKALASAVSATHMVRRTK